VAAPILLEAYGPDRTTTYPKMLQSLAEWVPDAVARRKILRDTPTRLFHFAGWQGRSPDGAKRNPGTPAPHCASLHAGYRRRPSCGRIFPRLELVHRLDSNLENHSVRHGISLL
jgi:hypothetical protein